MKILYKNPNDVNYNRWSDENGKHDIWYNANQVTRIYRSENTDLPTELVDFLNAWSEKINQYKKNYREEYPVKLAHVEFIYKDEVYSIYPPALSATYQTTFMSDTPYDVSWDSLFEKYEKEIREDLKRRLGVVYSRYFGMLD